MPASWLWLHALPRGYTSCLLSSNDVYAARFSSWPFKLYLPAVLLSSDGAPVKVNYPWDGSASGQIATYNASSDDETFRYLSLVYAKHNPGLRQSQVPCFVTSARILKILTRQ